MRILLVGEYSGLFNCLKDGLIALGHEVFLASDGDAYRDYPSDFRWDVKVKNGRLKQLLGLLNVVVNLKKFRGYDVVMFISTRVLYNRFIPSFNRWFYKYVSKANKKSFICDSGLDFIGFRYWFEHKSSKYYYYTMGYYDNKKGTASLLNKRAEKMEYEIRSYMNGLIPIWYEYAEPIRNLPNCKKTIRIPVNLEKFTYVPNKVKDKIVFFHGLTRQCKGGVFIIEAFNRLRQKYNDVAEFICDGGLPFEEYMKVTSRANCILDDVNSYSFSMNALFAMARGKIYMGGAEVEGNSELGYENCPVINLTRNVDQICQAIESVIANKERIEEMGLASRKFVEKYHNHIDIARQYVACWTESK